jgi:hypothetical protein
MDIREASNRRQHSQSHTCNQHYVSSPMRSHRQLHCLVFQHNRHSPCRHLARRTVQRQRCRPRCGSNHLLIVFGFDIHRVRCNRSGRQCAGKLHRRNPRRIGIHLTCGHRNHGWRIRRGLRPKRGRWRTLGWRPRHRRVGKCEGSNRHPSMRQLDWSHRPNA